MLAPIITLGTTALTLKLVNGGSVLKFTDNMQ